MTTRPPSPRRTPRQDRSRAMVDRILDAGQEMLIAHGYDGASTNRIATAAGISPGSLYQYFPNKDAIAALLDALDVHPEFLRAVMEQTPRLGSSSKLIAFEQRIGELTKAYLTINKNQIRSGGSYDTAAWMLVRMVEHLCVRYILDQPPIGRDEFIDEITVMALSYLRPWPTPPEDCL